MSIVYPDRKDGLLCVRNSGMISDKNQGAQSGERARPIPIKLI